MLLAIIGFSSCNNNTIYKKRHEFKDYTWNRFDSLLFETKIKDPQQQYNVYLTLRYITQYPNDFLKVNFTITSPSGDERTSMHSFKIRDKDGKLQGDVAGDIYDLKLRVKENMSFNTEGNFKFQIDNLMDHFDTPGLMDMGIIIEKAN